MSDPTGDALRASMINVPLMQVEALFGDADGFSAAVQSHRLALTNHMMGESGRARPVAHPIVEAVIARHSDTGPVADRSPDTFVELPWRIVDDRPKTPEQEQALSVLRETIHAA